MKLIIIHRYQVVLSFREMGTVLCRALSCNALSIWTSMYPSIFLQSIGLNWFIDQRKEGKKEERKISFYGPVDRFATKNQAAIRSSIFMTA